MANYVKMKGGGIGRNYKCELNVMMQYYVISQTDLECAQYFNRLTRAKDFNSKFKAPE